MLFNTKAFILYFLPITLIGTFLLARSRARMWTFVWLTVCSFVFYGWFRPEYLLLLFTSIGVNFHVGRRIMGRPRKGKAWLVTGIVCNLGLLGWRKYANFLDETVQATGLPGLQLDPILLPIGISFFTFQQIAYLMGCHAGIAHRTDVVRYSLFVSYFPQLIAGSIVHPNAVLPQFERNGALRLRWRPPFSTASRSSSLVSGRKWFSRPRMPKLKRSARSRLRCLR